MFSPSSYHFFFFSAEMLFWKIELSSSLVKRQTWFSLMGSPWFCSTACLPAGLIHPTQWACSSCLLTGLLPCGLLATSCPRVLLTFRVGKDLLCSCMPRGTPSPKEFLLLCVLVLVGQLVWRRAAEIGEGLWCCLLEKPSLQSACWVLSPRGTCKCCVLLWTVAFCILDEIHCPLLPHC